MRFPQRSTHGFTLVEILIVVVILGLIMAMSLVLLRSITATQKRSVTATRLANIEAAIVQFVMQQRRLPCPADGTLPPSTGGAERRDPGGNCIASQQDGVVPWVTLGLSAAEVTDGWDRRITYRVGATLVADNAMNLSWCDPAGTGGLSGTPPGCNSTCTLNALGQCTPPATYLSGQGLRVKNIAGTDVMLPSPGAGIAPTGAAYVLISHGESGGGAYLDSGQLSPGSATDGTEEQKNYANLVIGAYYVDDQITEISGANHFDDIVVRPSVLNVVTKAGLGPRAH